MIVNNHPIKIGGKEALLPDSSIFIIGCFLTAQFLLKHIIINNFML
jgi:hypothetical protein